MKAFTIKFKTVYTIVLLLFIGAIVSFGGNFMNTHRVIFRWIGSVVVIALLLQFALILPPASAAPLQDSAGLLTCYSDNPSVFDCVQIDPYTVRWNIIGNPYNAPNITGQFQVQYPNGLVYVTAHWDSPQRVSTFGWQTNPKGHYGIIGLPSVYVNDGGYGTPCSFNPDQLCGNYPVGTWNFTQDAVTNAFGRATVGFQQYPDPPATVYWNPGMRQSFTIKNLSENLPEWNRTIRLS